MNVLCTSLYLWFHDFELTGCHVKAEDLFMLGYTQLHTWSCGPIVAATEDMYLNKLARLQPDLFAT